MLAGFEIPTHGDIYLADQRINNMPPIVLFMAGPEQRTLSREMFGGIRENISPTITAVAVILTAVSVILLATIEGLRRRNERLKGNTS